MQLKVTKYVRITISLLISQKIPVKSEIENFFSETFNFAIFFSENRLFELCDDYDVPMTSYLEC